MSDLPVWLAISILILRIGGIGVIFALIASRIYHRSGRVALALCWALASLAWGYLGYRQFCSQPLACDAVMVDDHLLDGYWRDLMPGFTLIAGVTLAAALAAAIWLERRGGNLAARGTSNPARRILITGVVAFGTWCAATLAVVSVQGWPRV